MKRPTAAADVEPRWPVVLAIVAVALLLAALPERVRLFPAWAPSLVALAALAPMAGVGLSRASTRWLRIERRVTLVYVLLVGAGTVATLAYLVVAMVRGGSGIHGLQLLTSSIAVWVMNVLMFSLLYWQVDRGGPGPRWSGATAQTHWLFPQDGLPADQRPPGWRPVFADYLFLGFSTATAFSPTDTLPLTPRAKMMMMVQSTISLVTIVLVGARAINILGS
jgi:hypothetical protein